MMRLGKTLLGIVLGCALHAPAEAAVCTTNPGTTAWNNAATWSCGHVPLATDSVVISRAITLDANRQAVGLTVNAGVTFNNGARVLTLTGNLDNNGIITGVGSMNLIGAAAVLSGSGSFVDSRLYVSGTSTTIPVGANLNFSGGSRFYVGRNQAGTTVPASVLTINGTINSSVPTATTTFLRLYANNTVIGATGVINAGVSLARFYTNTATVTNNGSVVLNQITQNAASNAWTQGTNASLSLSAVSSVGTLTASATGNTVTYTAPATPITPAGNTYYNLGGTGVSCPHGFTVLGSDPCAPGAGAGVVTASPGNCVNQTGVGTLAWTTPANATASDNLYASVTSAGAATSNYLYCTGFNFSAIPAGATITGIVVGIERRAGKTNRARDNAVHLIKAGVIQTAVNRATATTYPTADTVENHGGTADLWGATWLDSDIKAANFGVAYSALMTKGTTIWADHIKVSVYYNTTSLDHVAISAPANDYTEISIPVTLTPHSAGHGAITSAPTLKLSTSTGTGDWNIGNGTGVFTPGAADSGQAQYQFGPGETSVTLGFTAHASGSVTFNVADISGNNLLANTPAGEKANTTTFTAANYVFTNGACTHNVPIGSGGCTAITWSPRTAGVALGNVYVTVVNAAGVPTRLHSSQAKTRSLQFALSCHNPTAHAGVQASFSASPDPLPLCTGATPAWSTAANVSFPAGSPSSGPYSFNYNDVGQVQLWVRTNNNGAEVGTSGLFVVKPAGFVVSNIRRSSDNFANPAASDAQGTKFVKAGENFSLKVTAVNAGGAPTPNFGKETPAETVKLTPALPAGLGLTHAPALNGSFGGFTNGEAPGTFNWDEVGIITLTPSIGDGSYLGAGDVTGTVTGNIGRFYPDHFAVQNALLEPRAELCNDGVLVADGVTPCSPVFAYQGERIDASFDLVPMSANGVALQNYVDSTTPASDWAKLDPTVFANLNLAAVDRVSAGQPHYLTARISNGGMPATVCSTTPCFTLLGAQAEARVTTSFALSRDETGKGPYTSVQFGIAPKDDDLASTLYDLDADDTVAGNDHTLLGNIEIRYGQLKLTNGAGSSLTDMPVALIAQYWDGSQWKRNADDCLTRLAAPADFSLSAWQGLAPGDTTVKPATLAFNAASGCGYAVATLSKPGKGKAGTVSLTTTALPYLPAAAPAYLSFGVADGRQNGSAPIIYMRESH